MRANITNRKPSNLVGHVSQTFRTHIATTSNYYPFGMQMVDSTYGCVGYRFGFNGMEKDDEVAGNGNVYSTMYRGLDARLGRWFSVEPKSRLTPWESPYASMGDNPISRLDPLGDKWDDSNDSKGKADNFRGKVKAERTKVMETKSSLESQLSAHNEGSKRYQKIADKINNTVERIGELDNTLIELDGLEASNQVYKLNPLAQLNDGVTLKSTNGILKTVGDDGGRTHWKDGVVIMDYAVGDLDGLAHELKHGFQFETGQTSFNRNRGKAGGLHDLTDEIAGYRRGSLFSTGRDKPLLRLSTKDLQSKGYSFPEEQLSIHSSLNEYFKANGLKQTVSEDVGKNPVSAFSIPREVTIEK